VSRVWQDVSRDFHERVRASCWDSLAGQLVNLHQPHMFDGEPVCRGCDRQHFTSEADDRPGHAARTRRLRRPSLVSRMLRVRAVRAGRAVPVVRRSSTTCRALRWGTRLYAACWRTKPTVWRR
jgi:hypothetical protein